MIKCCAVVNLFININVELKPLFVSQVTNLRKERETTITKVREESSQDAERVRILQKENSQLLLKLKTLTLELEELYAQREKQGFETDNITRVQSKQITEFSTTIKALEVKDVWTNLC